jgi:hypothetical protein
MLGSAPNRTRVAGIAIATGGGEEVEEVGGGEVPDEDDELEVWPPLEHATPIIAMQTNRTDVRAFMVCSFR